MFFRDAVRNASAFIYTWQLASGAIVFVHPEHFNAVFNVLTRYELRPHHIAVSATFEPHQRQALAAATTHGERALHFMRYSN